MTLYEQIKYVDKQAIHVIPIYIEPNMDIPEVEYHFHRSLEILLPVVGDLDVYCNGKHVQVHAGQLYIINSKEIHRVTGRYNNDYYMGFAFQIPYRILTFCNTDIERMIIDNIEAVHALILPVLYEIVNEYTKDEEYQFIKLTELTLQIMKTLLINCARLKEDKKELSDVHKDRIINITKYIKQNYHQRLKVSDIAEYFHYSYGHLEKIFKDNIGITIQEFIKDIRLSHVEKALLQGNKTVIEISEETGFPNVKSLTAYFKKRYGVTPKQYQKNMRI